MRRDLLPANTPSSPPLVLVWYRKNQKLYCVINQKNVGGYQFPWQLICVVVMFFPGRIVDSLSAVIIGPPVCSSTDPNESYIWQDVLHSLEVYCPYQILTNSSVKKIISGHRIQLVLTSCMLSWPPISITNGSLGPVGSN